MILLMTLLAKPIVRNYRMEDEQMHTNATTMHGNLTLDLAFFQAKFPWIDAAYLLSFLTDINTAKNYQQDTAVSNMIKVLTEDLNTSVAEGMKALDTLDVYARLAFPNSPANQRVFGQDKWEKARNDQQKMFKALKLAHSFADAAPYKAALLGKGMLQADIDNLDTIAQNIDLKDTLQEKAISGRPVTTEDRIRVNNIVWDRMKQISICSELVWRDNATKRAQYYLYPGGNGSANISVVIEGDINVAEIQTLDVSEVHDNPSSTVIIEVTFSPLGSFATDDPNGVPAGTRYDRVAPSTTLLSVEEFKTLIGWTPATPIIRVQNIGMAQGHYKFTFNGLSEA